MVWVRVTAAKEILEDNKFEMSQMCHKTTDLCDSHASQSAERKWHKRNTGIVANSKVKNIQHT